MQIAWPYPISKNRNRCIQIYFHLGEQILLEYHSCDIVLCNSMTQPIKLRCCVFNKVFLVKENGVIFLIVVTNGYVLVTLIGA